MTTFQIAAVAHIAWDFLGMCHNIVVTHRWKNLKTEVFLTQWLFEKKINKCLVSRVFRSNRLDVSFSRIKHEYQLFEQKFEHMECSGWSLFITTILINCITNISHVDLTIGYDMDIAKRLLLSCHQYNTPIKVHCNDSYNNNRHSDGNFGLNLEERCTLQGPL